MIGSSLCAQCTRKNLSETKVFVDLYWWTV